MSLKPVVSGSFPCRACGSLTEVLDSRPTHLLGEGAVRRRRICTNSKCRKRMTTYELHHVRAAQFLAVARLLREVLTIQNLEEKE